MLMTKLAVVNGVNTAVDDDDNFVVDVVFLYFR